MNTSEGDPSSDKKLRLLSLDGGGVRGMSTLLIIEELLRKVNPESPPKPCEYFDLIGGTSTGGLIAIMLGRLQMSIEECRAAYRELSVQAFQPVNRTTTPSWRKAPWKWKLNGRFDSAALEKGIKRIIVEKLRQRPENQSKTDQELEDTLLKDVDARCKVFVTATSSEMPDATTILPSYRSGRWPEDLLSVTKIWEAARATSAASTFFDPIEIGLDRETFVDGATGANNPVNQVWDEAIDIWKFARLSENIQCLVSIGTGVPDVKAFGNSLADIGQTLLAMSTETETTAQNFLRRHTDMHTERRYFRFNVLKGLEQVGLEDAEKATVIVAATRRYLAIEAIRKDLQSCADSLRQQERTIESFP
ncbi:MAG: hypothetical protein M1822_006232 [Bathelium mastoideum]|nr:MAG: hypothetical protein M1822_006232 [Bathelium mastoideum]